MAYGLHDLELTGLRVKTILSVHILHRPGEHGVMELTADLGEENGDFPIHETGSRQKIALYEKKDGRRNPLFGGVIVGLEVRSVGKSYHIRVKAYTSSYLMDIKKKSRSFQDTSMTMGTLIAGIVNEYGGDSQILFQDGAIEEIAVQYEETDWHFLKRMLSEWHVPLACNETREDICLYLGAAQIPAKQRVICVEKIWKDMDELSYWREAGENVQETEFINYGMKLDNHIMLYSNVNYRGRSLTAAKIEYRTIGSTVYEFVTLRKREGILQKPIYPMRLVGSALDGTILNIKGEKVQIHLKIDDAWQGNDCYWFPFSTPSASSDGSGWYCMPEKGDQVRVYFPSKKTGEAIAISAVSTYQPPTGSGAAGNAGHSGNGGNPGSSSGGYSGAGSAGGSSGGGNSEGYSGGGAFGGGDSGGGGSSGGNQGVAAAAGGAATANGKTAAGKEKGKDKMSDPTTKYLQVPSGQQINLSPKGIEVLCSGGSVKIEVLKSGKINISATKSIQIVADEDIRLKAKLFMKVRCKETAYVASQMGGSIYMNDEGKLVVQGTEVHMN